jgi:hypothetical protein
MNDGPVDVTTNPEKIVASLAALSERAQEELMYGPSGRAVLDEIFRQMRDTFRPELAKDEDALVRFVITNRTKAPDDIFELNIRDGMCTLAAPADTTAVKGAKVLSITMDRVRFVRVVTGQASGAKLFLQRKIKINGDLKFGGRVISWFDIPREK